MHEAPALHPLLPVTGHARALVPQDGGASVGVEMPGVHEPESAGADTLMDAATMGKVLHDALGVTVLLGVPEHDVAPS